MRPAPSTRRLCEFVELHRGRFGVAPICRALTSAGLTIAPNTYYAHRRRGPSKRALWDTTITEVLAGFYEPDAVDDARPRRLDRDAGDADHGPTVRVVRSTSAKNGAPTNAVTTPIGSSAGASAVRATTSASTRNAAPTAIDSGTITR